LKEKKNKLYNFWKQSVKITHDPFNSREKNLTHVKFTSVIKRSNILCICLMLSHSDTALLHREKGCSTKNCKKDHLLRESVLIRVDAHTSK